MDAIEVVIYLSLALIVGLLFLGFINNWNFTNIYDAVSDAMFGKKEFKFKEVEGEEAIAEILGLWEKCKVTSQNQSINLYLKGQGVFSKQYIFEAVKKLNLCLSLQSIEEDCGEEENLVMSDINMPSVINIECLPDDKRITISS